MPVRPDQLEEAGILQLLPHEPVTQVVVEAVAEDGVVDLHVRQLAPDDGEVGQDAQVFDLFEVARAPRPWQVAAVQVPEHVGEHAAVAIDSARVSGEDSAVHDHERFGRDFQQTVGVGVRERQEASLQQTIEDRRLRGQ